MFFGAISDVHGNVWALEAVLNALSRRGVKQVINLGDHLYGPLEPVATFGLLRDCLDPCLSGNCDRLLLETTRTSEAGTLARNRAEITEEQRQWLGDMPSTLLWHGVRLCHGTPGHDDVYLLEDSLGRDCNDNELADRLGQHTESLVLCGHSHIPKVRQLRTGALVVNVGSVGLQAYTEDSPSSYAMQSGSPQARCFVFENVSGEWQFEQLYVPYDTEAAANCALKNGRADWAEWLRTGRA